jgi:hypothetical protein
MANETENKKSVSEKTHAKNLENTYIANSIVASLGAVYNPNNPL